MTGRREFILAVSGLLTLSVLGQDRSARGQDRRKRIGLAAADLLPAFRAAFVDELLRLDWRESENFELDITDGAGDPASLPKAISDLVRRSPDVIISSSNRTHFALRDATSEIPIVVVSTIDPIVLGLSDSIARPSRNFTGTVGYIDVLMAKRVELLHEALPQARRIALHLDPSNPAFPATSGGAIEAAKQFGMDIVVAGYAHRDQVVPSLDRAKAQGADALIVVPDAIALPHIPAIAQRATSLELPTLGFNPNELALGFTFVLGPDRVRLWREAARMADKLLRGASVSEIPFQQPTTVNIGVNVRSARALGIALPQSILIRADEVIE